MDSFINKVLESHEKTLDLSNRGLHAVTVDMVRLGLASIERMALNGNSLTVLSSDFLMLKTLRYLNIKSNQFLKFPAVLCSMDWLEILDISRNRIDALPDNLKSMSSLKVIADYAFLYSFWAFIL